MLVEKIIFNIIAFSLFVYILFKMIKKNDTSYLSLLLLQAVRNSIKSYRNFEMGSIRSICKNNYVCFFNCDSNFNNSY